MLQKVSYSFHQPMSEVPNQRYPKNEQPNPNLFSCGAFFIAFKQMFDPTATFRRQDRFHICVRIDSVVSCCFLWASCWCAALDGKTVLQSRRWTVKKMPRLLDGCEYFVSIFNWHDMLWNLNLISWAISDKLC